MKRQLIILTIILLLLTACGPEEVAEAPVPPAPTAAQAAPATDTRSVSTEPASPTATAVPIPTNTPAAEPTDPPEPSTEAIDEASEAPAEVESGSQPAFAEFFEEQCPFDPPADLVVDCGYLQVPENRARADSPDIELAVAILRAPGPAEPDPIIYLAGGPGGSALSDFGDDPDSWTDYPFSQNRDLIFIDQRGTGYSWPTLNCHEAETDEPQEGIEADLACRDRLVADGIDLTAYNTTENAADIAALAQALDYNQYNLLGISYGTRLALNVMRDHAQGLRSVVLDSPFPPNAHTAAEESIHTLIAIETLFQDCASDPACNDTFPDLEAVFLETVERLNNAPDPEIFGDDLVDTVVQSLNAGREFIELLPLMIYLAAEDDFEIYDLLNEDLSGGGASAHFGVGQSAQRQGDDDVGEDVTDSEGMYNSVICHDEYAFANYDEAEQIAVAEIPETLLPALFATTEQLFAVCDAWGAGQAAAIENEAVVSDIPTLVMVGQYDPATPPTWGRLTVASLSRGYLFEFPGEGHSLLSGVECAIQATAEFIADPSVEPDRTCLEQMTGPAFVVE